MADHACGECRADKRLDPPATLFLSPDLAVHQPRSNSPDLITLAADEFNKDAPTSAGPILLLAASLEGGLVVLALACSWLFEIPLVATDEPVSLQLVLKQGCLGAIPLLVALVFVEWLPIPDFIRFRRLMRATVVPLFRQLSVSNLLLVSCLAGLGEEVFFRGIVQTLLDRMFDPRLSPGLGIVLAGVVFGFAHSISRMYVGLATLVGVYLGWLFWYSNVIWVPVVTHALYDFLALIYYIYLRPDVSHDLGEL